MARIVLRYREALGSSVHMEVADIRTELRLVQVEANVRTEIRENEIIDPNASPLTADMAPLLVFGRERTVEACRYLIIELQFCGELHRHWFRATDSLQG